ncbi:uncharacterized protein LOC126998320 [Eriocheir sinensis]|uniref:uncharacterized protein LOC126998320 n=1 Tax=Eriocheir sinensis TaxID=95602 RepID=UPI0021C87371|nr:uncharacterized protein LOC126998320 [Eriocheir sinensis]
MSLKTMGSSHPVHAGQHGKCDCAIPPWWEADECQCESQACGNPSVTFRSLFRDEAGGTCGPRARAAGDGQRVISFSLFGNDSEYWKGLGQILPEVEKLYPGWKVRVYTNPRGRAAALCPLLHRHPSLLFVCDVTNLPPPLGNLSSVHPMIWRVAPLGDPQVDTMIVRDTDSQVTQRQVAAVQEWLASGKAFHVMRDHPNHDMPVMGGMWGATWGKDPAKTGRIMRTLRAQVISRSAGKKQYGKDQRVLKQRPGLRKKYENSSISQPCPESCRPPAHRDWLYC